VQEPAQSPLDRLTSAVEPTLPTGPGELLAWERLYGCSGALAIVAAARRHPGPVLVVVADTRAVQQLEDELRFFAGADEDLPILPYPDWETLPYDAFSPHHDITSQRLLTLFRLPRLQRGIVVLAVSNLMQRVPPTDYVAGYSFLLERGDRLDIAALRGQLEKAAYRCVGQVMEPGEFAVRGGLVDIFPMGSTRPYRIDLFGDEVEGIRHFDPETQRSEEHVERIRLLPAREFPFTDESIRAFRGAFRERFAVDPGKCPIYRDVSKGLTPPGIEYYFPLFLGTTATLFDYLPTRRSTRNVPCCHPPRCSSAPTSSHDT
jgi:transcription-repair coupling factor (superfamily II helicase)